MPGRSLPVLSLAAALLWLARTAEAVEPLRPGVLYEGVVGSGEQVFEVVLEAGRLARVELTQVGIDAALTVSGPDGGVLATVDQARVRESLETFTWIVTASGPHRVVVRARRSPPGSRFLLRLDAGPPVDAKTRIEAERAFGEGVR